MTFTKTFLAALALLFTTLLAPAAFAGETIASGSEWENVGKRTSGDWAIVEKDGKYYVELGDSFKTRNAPDLKIYLSKEEAGSLGDKNGLQNTVFIAELSANKGAQSYELPEGVTPADFESLVIYCEAFSKFWAATSI